jgi:type III secretion protein C
MTLTPLSVSLLPHGRFGRRLGIAALFAASMIVAQAASAMPVPSGDRKVNLTAREQPVGAFLQDLFGVVDVPVSVSPAVKGAVNGAFNSDIDGIARNVARAFGLVMYYDGSVMHVYAAGESVARTLPTTTAVADKVIQSANEMGLPDSHNVLRGTRGGALAVNGTRRFAEQIEELTRASQVNEAARPPLGFKVFHLRYAWVQDVTVNFGGRQVVVPGVASTVRSLVTAMPRTQISLAGQEQYLRPTQPKLKGKGLARSQPVLGLGDAQSRSGNADALSLAYGGGGAGGGGGAASGATTPSIAENALMLGDMQQVRIEADTRLNALIVRDAPERLPIYEELVRQLDVEPQSVEIEATIIDVNTERLRELGINWRANIGRTSVLLGNGTESDLRLQNGLGTLPASITPLAKGGVVSAVLGDAGQFVARINALQTEGAARVVSSPQVVTLSNVEAIFDNSSTFYVRVAGRDEVDLFNVSAGTSLRVTPHVFKDARGTRIKLLVNLEDSALSDAKVDAIPIVSRSAINTQALIYEGESLLIGGLTRESSDTGTDKVPFLGDIPLLGRLFKTQRDGGARVERMFLISPRLSAGRPPLIERKTSSTLPAAVPGALPVLAAARADVSSPPGGGAP